MGKRLLVIEKMNDRGVLTGDYLIAADAVGAGADERVLVVFGSKDAPVRSVVVGIIDDIVSG